MYGTKTTEESPVKSNRTVDFSDHIYQELREFNPDEQAEVINRLKKLILNGHFEVLEKLKAEAEYVDEKIQLFNEALEATK